jgi:hypothetical protein
MGLVAKVQQYLGLKPVQVLEDFQKAERSAQLICARCGAFVAHETQTLHTNWHLDLDSRP